MVEMETLLTPSVFRCPGTVPQRALLLNELGCERVHVDISIGCNYPGLFPLSQFGRKERDLFVSRVDFHIFPMAETGRVTDLPLQEGDRVIVHSPKGGSSLAYLLT